MPCTPLGYTRGILAPDAAHFRTPEARARLRLKGLARMHSGFLALFWKAAVRCRTEWGYPVDNVVLTRTNVRPELLPEEVFKIWVCKSANRSGHRPTLPTAHAK